MRFSDDLLIAYINGELAEPARAAVERAMRADPVLAARIARHRAEQHAQQAHNHSRQRGEGHERHGLFSISANGREGRKGYEGANPATGPAQQTVPPCGAKVVHLNSLRPGRPVPPPQLAYSNWCRRHWVAIGAAFVFGAAAGALGWRTMGADPGLAMLDDDNGTLVARGPLVAALDGQLASPGPSGSGVRIGVTFVARDGGYCRSFVVDTIAGLGCLSGGRWTIPVLAQGQAGAAYIDGSMPPPAVREAIEQRIVGAILDTDAERAAQQRGWRQ